MPFTVYFVLAGNLVVLSEFLPLIVIFEDLLQNIPTLGESKIYLNSKFKSQVQNFRKILL